MRSEQFYPESGFRSTIVDLGSLGTEIWGLGAAGLGVDAGSAPVPVYEPPRPVMSHLCAVMSPDIYE